MDRLAGDYRFTSRHSFLNWLNYAQYRKYLILRKTYPLIVVSDITNFFNSVLHSEVSRAFRSLLIPGEMVGLLFFLLERLAIRSTYCDSPGIGLPIDEFECSRTIANLILFPHDRRMVKLVGREAYVRWMDDHVIGVNSEAQGLRVLAAMQDSLASLYLTPNAKKSLVLSLAEAKIHFHLDTNADLDGLESKVAIRAARRVALVANSLARGVSLCKMRARASGNRYRAVSTGSRALPRRASFGGARSQISSRILVSRRGSAVICGARVRRRNT